MNMESFLIIISERVKETALHVRKLHHIQEHEANKHNMAVLVTGWCRPKLSSLFIQNSNSSRCSVSIHSRCDANQFTASLLHHRNASSVGKYFHSVVLELRLSMNLHILMSHYHWAGFTYHGPQLNEHSGFNRTNCCEALTPMQMKRPALMNGRAKGH